MPAEETKHDLLLKRAQIGIAILVGLVSLVLGIFNVRKAMKGPEEKVIVQQAAAPAQGSQLRSALEDVGSSWIRKLGKTDPESSSQSTK